MRHTALAAAAATALLVGSGTAQAGVYADDLGKCVVAASTSADQVTFVRWFFAALSAHPAVKPMVNITAAQKEQLNRETAALMERLLLKDCRKEAAMALRVEGEEAITASFGLFGETAAGDLMSHKEVAVELERLGSFVDEAAWEGLTKEADALRKSR